jgi:hypothetical protein
LKEFEGLVFWGKVRRRGVHVSTLKIGSRVGLKCIGGILGFYADLRRELGWGNFKLDFFEGLGGFPRETIEEGGQTVCILGV